MLMLRKAMQLLFICLFLAMEKGSCITGGKVCFSKWDTSPQRNWLFTNRGLGGVLEGKEYRNKTWCFHLVVDLLITWIC